MKKGNWIFIFVLILIAGLSRLLPHPPNFTALGAMALFGGAALSNKILKVLLPLVALFITDVILNNTVFAASNQGFTLFYPGALWTYVAIASIALLAPLLINKLSVQKVVLGSLMASVVFFVISNFGAWASGVLYPMTLEGLATCYIAAIPFFANTLGGDVLFSGILFGGFYLAGLKMPKLALIKN
ncbi:MAG: hypothetical protein CL842_03410 [Crocinitomicaceae bacterium]|nr:hypothetical protein [Crocinitomicaceae bacterium]|tara:strand:+ start:38256 stop:38813 length:558 start_codon:yes stop_codon:yes gene_type:complete